MLTLNLKRIAHIRAAKGWTTPSLDNIHEKLLLVVNEVIEAHNELRDKHHPTAIYYSAQTGFWCRLHHNTHCVEAECNPVARITDVNINYSAQWERFEISKPEGFGIELVDAMMRLADIGHALGIDLQKCARLKMDFNEARPYQHGGRPW